MYKINFTSFCSFGVSYSFSMNSSSIHSWTFSFSRLSSLALSSEFLDTILEQRPLQPQVSPILHSVSGFWQFSWMFSHQYEEEKAIMMLLATKCAETVQKPMFLQRWKKSVFLKILSDHIRCGKYEKIVFPIRIRVY